MQEENTKQGSGERPEPKEKFTVPVVQLPSGKMATFLVPEVNSNQSLSVVDTDVLRKLITFLPSASFSQIREDFIQGINETTNLNEFTDALIRELNFHKSVNIMDQFFRPESSK